MDIKLVNGDWLIVGNQVAVNPACCCAPPCSGECTSNEDCEGDCRCCDGQCQSDPCACASQEDCQPCEDCVDGECVSLCAEGEYCCDGVCQEEPCDECDENNPCPEGQVCVDGVCRDQCETDEDCPEGQVCVDGVCVDECDPPCSPGYPNCETCVDGECIPNGECAETEACCLNQLGVGGCWPFPDKCGDNWCSICAEGSTETRIGPYPTFFEAGLAGEAVCDNDCDDICNVSGAFACNDGNYVIVCCTPEVP